MTTIINLLKHDTTKSAGITMLGKSIEIALPEFKKKCEPSYWPELERVLDQVFSFIFIYSPFFFFL